jgi:hypothetical protein
MSMFLLWGLYYGFPLATRPAHQCLIYLESVIVRFCLRGPRHFLQSDLPSSIPVYTNFYRLDLFLGLGMFSYFH